MAEKKTLDSKIKASVKYNRNRDAITIRPTKEEGAMIRKAAEDAGMPLQQFILQCLREYI